MRVADAVARGQASGWVPLATNYPWQYRYLRARAKAGKGKVPPGFELRTSEVIRLWAKDLEDCQANAKDCIFDLSKVSLDDIRVFQSGYSAATAGFEAYAEHFHGAAWGEGINVLRYFWAPPCGNAICKTPTAAYAPTVVFENQRDAYEDYDFIMGLKKRIALGLKLPVGAVKQSLGQGQLAKGNWQFFRPLYLAPDSEGTISVKGDVTLYTQIDGVPNAEEFDCTQAVADAQTGLRTCKVVGPGYVYAAIYAADKGGTFDLTVDLSKVTDKGQWILDEIMKMKNTDYASDWLRSHRMLTFDMSAVIRGREALGRSFEAYAASGSACELAKDTLSAGDLCDENAQCESGFCADNTCCDKKCDGACDTCAKAFGAEADGKCGYVKTGETCKEAGKEGICSEEGVCEAGPSKCTETKDCDSGYCIGGICCEKECDSECQQCSSDGASCDNLAEDTECADGGKCESGVCKAACDTGKTDCGGGCVDTQSDNDNCGICGNGCKASDGKTCEKGVCTVTCVTGLSDCNGQCVDVQTSTDNCGSCGNACNTSAGETCEGGSCLPACATGLNRCGGKCVDLQKDSGNCGKCSAACTITGQECQSGSCACTGQTILCGVKCIDAQTDASHCGSCNNACENGGGTCNAGTCAPVVPKADGEKCASTAGCVSGNCSADGFCCATACAGDCNTCYGGACAAIYGGFPCTDAPGGVAGLCDGSGSCAPAAVNKANGEPCAVHCHG